MSKFQVNEENALDLFVQIEAQAAVAGDMVWYCVVCQHDLADGVGSHGGFVCRNARSAIDLAKQGNETGPEHACRYTAIPITMSMNMYAAWLEDLNMVPPDDRT